MVSPLCLQAFWRLLGMSSAVASDAEVQDTADGKCPDNPYVVQVTHSIMNMLECVRSQQSSWAKVERSVLAQLPVLYTKLD